MSFDSRHIKIRFQLSGDGKFASGKQTHTIEGLRVAAKITRAGTSSAALMDCTIFGLTLSDMNQLVELGWIMDKVKNNGVILQAKTGDTGTYATVFEGTVNFSWIDGQSQPQMCFRVSAGEGSMENALPIDATSFDGPTDVTTVLKSLAKQAKPPLTFEDNGVKAILSSPYLSGSLGTQIYEVIKQAGLMGGIMENRKLAVWKKEGNRKTSQEKPGVVSPATGLIGYPSFTQQQIIARLLFNPTIKGGDLITIEGSDIKVANRQWSVGQVTHDLESETTKGMWFTTIIASDPKVAGSAPVPSEPSK